MNTTELIARLKAAAQEEIMCREAGDTSDLWQDDASPENVLALVEALELKEEQRANWFQMAQKLGEDLDAAEKRIAELEARAVSVNVLRYDLDMSGCDSCGQDCGADMSEDPDGDYVLITDVVEKLAAAGIKCEVKGE